MKKLINKTLPKNGLTLVEVLITLLIFVVVSGLLLIILFNTSGLQFRQSFKIDQGLRSNDALIKVKENIKVSLQVAVGYPENFPTFTSGNNILVLKVASVDQSNNIIANTFDYFVYVVENGSLKEKVFPSALSSRKSTDEILAQNIESFILDYTDSSGQSTSPSAAVKVKSSLKVAQKIGAKQEATTATAEAYLRNH